MYVVPRSSISNIFLLLVGSSAAAEIIIPIAWLLVPLLACHHQTMRRMSFKVDHSKHSRNKKSPETKETYAQGLLIATFHVYISPAIGKRCYLLSYIGGKRSIDYPAHQGNPYNTTTMLCLYTNTQSLSLLPPPPQDVCSLRSFLLIDPEPHPSSSVVRITLGWVIDRSFTPTIAQ